MSGGISAVSLSLWIAYWGLFNIGVEWLNRLVDLPADRVNQPERTRMALAFGVRGLRYSAVGTWLIVVGISVAIVLTLNPADRLIGAVALTVNMALGVGYSAGRFVKRRPKVSLLMLSVPLAMPWISGLIAGADSLDTKGLYCSVAIIALLGTSSLAITGVKDLTDVVGDRLIGYRSAWLQAATSKPARITALLLAIQLSAAICIIVLSHTPASAAALAVIPLEFSIALLALRCSSIDDFAAVREYMYLVLLCIVTLTGLAATASLHYAAVAIVLFAGWGVLSHYVHWHRLFSARLFVRVIDLSRREPGGAIKAMAV